MTILRSKELRPPGDRNLDEIAVVVTRYFALFNLGEFEQVADLFAAEGKLCTPFESPVVGKVAIANYLREKAGGMKAKLSNSEAFTLEDGSHEINMRGKVTTPAFTVNVAWSFSLTPQNQIQSVCVDLLASSEELLKFRFRPSREAAA